MVNKFRSLCRHADAWSAIMTPGVVATIFYFQGHRFLLCAYKIPCGRGHWIVRLTNNDALLGVEHAIITLAAVSRFSLAHILESESLQGIPVYRYNCLFYSYPQISRQHVVATFSKVQSQGCHCHAPDENETNGAGNGTE